jgi:hypothetical protein
LSNQNNEHEINQIENSWNPVSGKNAAIEAWIFADPPSLLSAIPGPAAKGHHASPGLPGITAKRAFPMNRQYCRYFH